MLHEHWVLFNGSFRYASSWKVGKGTDHSGTEGPEKMCSRYRGRGDGTVPSSSSELLLLLQLLLLPPPPWPLMLLPLSEWFITPLVLPFSYRNNIPGWHTPPSVYTIPLFDLPVPLPEHSHCQGCHEGRDK